MLERRAKILYAIKVSPVCQAQDKKLQECRIKQQLLVAFWELGEARHFLRPATDDAHGAHQEVIKLLDVKGLISGAVEVRVWLKLERKSFCHSVNLIQQTVGYMCHFTFFQH